MTEVENCCETQQAVSSALSSSSSSSRSSSVCVPADTAERGEKLCPAASEPVVTLTGGGARDRGTQVCSKPASKGGGPSKPAGRSESRGWGWCWWCSWRRPQRGSCCCGPRSCVNDARVFADSHHSQYSAKSRRSLSHAAAAAADAAVLCCCCLLLTVALCPLPACRHRRR